MTFRSYYTPPTMGRRILTPHQTAILILKNNKKIAKTTNNDAYSKFKMLETQIASISGSIFSATERWALIEAMNELGWQVAICRNYWTFIQTIIVDRWPTLDHQEIVDLATTVSRTPNDKQHGPLSEAFESFDITELTKFFYNKKELKDAVQATVDERNWEKNKHKVELDWDKQREEIEQYISQIDITSNDLNEYIRTDEFTIWEYLYYDLFKSNLILDVLQLKAKIEK